MTDNKPKMKLRAGGITATVWSNTATGKDGKPIEYDSVKIERSYKDKKDEWQTTNSYAIGDLLRLAELAKKTYREMGGVKVEKSEE